MKETWTTVLQALGLAWWVEVTTAVPHCTYYFGPFASAAEAEGAKAGYVEDLEQEGAIDIQANVKRCRPMVLTVEEQNGRGPSPAYTG
ncbi:MAG TPA: DUF1816 domain-containing protein [Synechococcales cyanobacterium M55_K2018_004]|nr:DUF1816 domain-containing protein [Synechococcales cyanobacterium M55_K2018_004]